MSIIIVVLMIIIPLLMLCSAWLFHACKQLWAAGAVGCAYVFGGITTIAVYQILRDDTVFMTDIHRVFTNKLFLFCGAYLGAYGIYMLLLHFLKGLRTDEV